MSDEYQFRNINLGKLADFVRSNGGLDETPALHLLDTIRVMRAQNAKLVEPLEFFANLKGDWLIIDLNRRADEALKGVQP